jgi:regulator of sirC expression with transglutaminase-like and TPR domain
MPDPPKLAVELDSILTAPDPDLVRAAMWIATIETPALEVSPAVARVHDLGDRIAARVGTASAESSRTRIGRLNDALYREEGFRGDVDRYDDLRNSLLNVVLERRLGIPITLAVLYMAVAKRAGIDVFGVAFPGHFLLRIPNDAGDDGDPTILDPFDGGRRLDRRALIALLARHTGGDVRFSRRLLAPCSPRRIVVRMLNNLKRLYVSTRSFPQAWRVADLLVHLDGCRPEDLRDRGLLAYHLDDVRRALNDLETYLGAADETRDADGERRQIRAHVQTLRRRVASMN